MDISMLRTPEFWIAIVIPLLFIAASEFVKRLISAHLRRRRSSVSARRRGARTILYVSLSGGSVDMRWRAGKIKRRVRRIRGVTNFSYSHGECVVTLDCSTPPEPVAQAIRAAAGPAVIRIYAREE